MDVDGAHLWGSNGGALLGAVGEVHSANLCVL